MSQKTLPLIVYVSRDGLSFCSSDGQTPVSLKFGHDVVSDLEVVNAVQLSAEIKKFFATGKFKPTNAVLVLSDTIYFEKNYQRPNAPGDKELEDFADKVPFSAVSSKLLPYGGGFRQIVINRDYYETILRTLEQLQFKISNVLPAFVLGITGPEITSEHCQAIYHKLDQAVSVGSLLTSPGDNTFEKKEQAFMEKNKIPIIILSAVLVLVALVTAYITLAPPAPKPRAGSESQVIPKVPLPTLPAPTPSPEPASPSAAILNSLTVRIVNASGLPGRAASLSALLAKSGFTKVQTGNSNTRSTSTIITVSPYAATAAGEYVSRLVSSLYPDPISATDSSAKTDLIITIGTK